MHWLLAIAACRPLPAVDRAHAPRSRGGGLVLELEQTLIGPEGSAYGRSFARGDVNGDALPDLVVGAPHPDGGRIDLYLGEAGSLASAPAWSFTGGPGTGSALAGCDVDADGFDEIVVGDPVEQVVRVFPGWPTGPQDPITLTGAPANGAFGAAVACGDVDDNEVDDVVVGSPAGGGRVEVWFGGPFGLVAAPGWSVEGEGGWGRSVAVLGDVDGDEYGELAVGTDAGAVVFYGTETVPGAAPDWALPGGAAVVAATDDLDNDGYRDLLIGEPDLALASFVRGTADGLAEAPAWTATEAPGSRFGAAVLGLPDLDGDGRSELAVSAPAIDLGEGAAYVFRGTSDGVEPLPAVVIHGGSEGAGLEGLGSAGDLDRDGLPELALGVLGAGWVWLYAPVIEPVPTGDSGTATTDPGGSSPPVDTGSAPDPDPPAGGGDVEDGGGGGCGCAAVGPGWGWLTAGGAALAGRRRAKRCAPGSTTAG